MAAKTPIRAGLTLLCFALMSGTAAAEEFAVSSHGGAATTGLIYPFAEEELGDPELGESLPLNDASKELADASADSEAAMQAFLARPTRGTVATQETVSAVNAYRPPSDIVEAVAPTR